MVKRFAGVKGPGIKGLIDPLIGMKENYTVGILSDTVVDVAQTRELFKNLFFGTSELTPDQQKEFDNFMSFFGSSFESTDAQGFMLPSRASDIAKGFEKSWEFGKVYKPIHFGVYAKTFAKDGPNGPVTYSTAKPVYIKNSTIELTDDLVARFPLLSKIRSAMEKQNLDELVFSSAVKEGAPDTKYYNLKEIVDNESKEVPDNLKIPFLELSNHNYRLQFNASADPNKKVAIFTQLQYFLNVYGTPLKDSEFDTTQEAARKVYSLVSELINSGSDELFSEIDKSLKNFLKKEFKGPGSQRALDILTSGNTINHPLIEKKAITAISSALEKATIKIKFNGGKLVLQSAEGISLYPDVDMPENAKQLSYKIEDVNGRKIMVAEVIMPRELLTPEQLGQIGSDNPLFLLGDGFAFRIPSTELHSAVALRVVGTYSNSKSNVIIAPKELVPIHGSDFDVDSLFVITRDNFSKKDSLTLDPYQLSTMVNSISNLYNTILQLRKDNTDLELNAKYIQVQKTMNQLFKVADDVEIQDDISESIEKEFITQLRRKNPIEDRVEWGKRNGYIFKDNTWAIQSTANVAFLKAKSQLLKIAEDTPELTNLINRVLTQGQQLSSKEQELFGDENTPVGYSKNRSGAYVINADYLQIIDTYLNEFINVRDNLQEELQSMFLKDINSSIDALKSIRSKYIKNSIIEVMLDVITDESNRFRMTTPIAFNPLVDSIKAVNKVDELPVDNYDLSDMEDEYRAYSSLTAGVVLTGGFANASKSFGYLSQAGSDEFVNSLYDILSAINNATTEEELAAIVNSNSERTGRVYGTKEATEEVTEENTSAKKLTSLQSAKQRESAYFRKRIKSYISAMSKDKFFTPKLNANQRFKIKYNDTTYSFDSLSEFDVLNNYSVTQVLDALTNAAIDNLKLGYLFQARINQYSGSAVVGLVSVGVPIDYIVYLLNQGVFDDLYTGKVNNISKWVDEKVAEYSSAPENVLSLDDLKINNNKQTFADAIRLFAKGHKIGEDMRNFSSFLSIIQEINPFVEDIFSVVPRMQREIGNLITDDMGNTVLVTNSDFSFISPNLLGSAPHVKAALDNHLRLVDKIENTFLIHSKPVQKFANTIDSEYAERLAASENNTRIRRTFSKYVLASTPEVMARLAQIKPKVITIDKNNITLSGQRVFNDEVANKIMKLKMHDKSRAVFGSMNYFLHNISVQTSDSGSRVLKFRSSIGLSQEDIGKIILGFRELSKYSIVDDKVVENNNPSNFISDIQKDLAVYALLNMGLENVTSSFATYMPPSMFENALDYYVNTLNKMIKSDSFNDYREHFNLYYNLSNSKSLTKPDYTLEELSSSGTKHGIDNIDNTQVVYDRKYDKTKAAEGTKQSFPLFIKESYDKTTTVFIKVYESADGNVHYYQKVGNIKDVFVNNMIPDYSISKHFSKDIKSIPYLHSEENKDGTINIRTYLSYSSKNKSYEGLSLSIKQGDVFAMYPNDNYDRTNRQFVRLVKSSSTKNNNIMTVQPINLAAVANALGASVQELENLNPSDLMEKLKCYG
jgi:hypothetical protein